MVKKIVLLSLVVVSLMGGEVMDLYRQGGMAAIQKEIDRGFGDRNFWAEKLLGNDLHFGYFETTNTLLICEKNQPSLALYRKDNKGHFIRLKTIPAFTGKYDGDKMNEGDRRTPIGVYNLTEKRDNVDPFYGPMAFVTSYPNLYDRIRGKSGDGIWVHGVPFTGSRDPFTKGCVAINNDDLLQLDKNINLSNTLLIIDSSLKQWVQPDVYSTILAQLYSWKSAWSENDLTGYLSFYAPDFRRADGMGLQQFKLYKERIFAKQENKTISFDDINIIPYPGETRNLFWITYHQVYESDTHRFEGEKALLVRLNKDRTISIVTED